jgi:hypothetical protein
LVVLALVAGTPVASFIPSQKLTYHPTAFSTKRGVVLKLAKEEGIMDTANVPTDFVNEGPLAWMSTFLDLFGMKEGKSLFFALPLDVDEDKRASPQDAKQLKAAAAVDLVNISSEERARRGKAGSYMWALSSVYVLWASLVADNGDLLGHVLRLLAAFPVFFALGFQLSAETGL